MGQKSIHFFVFFDDFIPFQIIYVSFAQTSRVFFSIVCEKYTIFFL